MTPTHAISADEARRLLAEDRERQHRVRAVCVNEHEWAGAKADMPKRCPVCDVEHGEDSFIEAIP